MQLDHDGDCYTVVDGGFCTCGFDSVDKRDLLSDVLVEILGQERGVRAYGVLMDTGVLLDWPTPTLRA